VIPLSASDFPSPEFIIFAVAILLGIIGKIVEFSKKVRKRSLEETERRDRQFGEDLGEAPEPPPVEPAPVRVRIEPVRRPLPPRIPWRPVPGLSPEFRDSPPPPPPVTFRPPAIRTVVAPPRPAPPHPVLRMLRLRHGARTGIILSEILGPPKAARRWR